MKVTDFLARLERVKPAGENKWMALCPGHNDQDPSLSITEADGKILLKCFAGCDLVDILKPLGLEQKDLFFDGHQGKSMGGYTNVGKACEHVNTPPNRIQKQLTPPMLTPVNSVNTRSISEAKCLPADFLKGLGISDCKYGGQPSIRIPYYSETREEVAVRFRLALSGDSRFKWRKGDHAMPYGLDRLARVRRAGWILIVEGESDAWTCWHHGIPALGIPGKNTWRAEWGEYLKGLEVYVWQEPAAEDFVLRVLKSAPELRFIRATDDIKDISEAHIQGHNIPALIEELKARSESARELKIRHDNKRLSELYGKAKKVIEADDPLELVADALDKLGYGGDLKPVLITYLAATSRLLAMTSGTMPVHLLLTGSSSLGKSYVLDVVKRLLPEEAYHSISAGSPRTLIYDDFDLKHRVIEFGEADSLPAGEDNPAASAIRNLLQDHALNYDVTIRDKETGDYTVRKVRKPGPTVLITTSVRSLGAQLMTRLFTLEISASKEQTKAVLKTRARIAFEGGTQSPDNALITFQEYLQAKVPIKVAVPFVFELAEAMGKMTLTSTSGTYRDFERLLSFVRSVAILRQHHRQIDSDGRIVATLADYNTARELVNDMYVDSSTGITDDVRQLVEAVRELEGQGRITNARLAKHLDISVMQASRRARKALGQDWIINNERRKYHPADYAPGEPMPEAEGLPILILRDEDEGGDQVVNTVNIVNSKAVNAFSFKSGTVNTLTPITDDGTPPNIPCIKDGLGICILRTDDSKLFQCGENPKRCQFKKVDALRTCFACGSTDFWARPDGGLVCSWCHPKV